LDIAIVGAPNAGKSQLLNVLLQQKVAAVSRKRHTTRGGILGVRTLLEHNTQLVFVDTPGFVKSNQRGSSSTSSSSKKQDPDIIYELSSAAIAEMEAVDYTLLVIDAARSLGSPEADEPNPYRDALIALMIRATLAKGRKRLTMSKGDGSKTVLPELKETFGVVFNKVDLVTPKMELLDLAEQVGVWADEVMIEYAARLKGTRQSASSTMSPPESKNVHKNSKSAASPPEWEKVYPEFFYTSALHNEGVDDILNHLIEMATPCERKSATDDYNDDDDEEDDEEADDWLIPPSNDDAPGAGPSTSSFLSSTDQVEEIIREKLYRCLHREVPHHVRQINRTFQYANVPKGANLTSNRASSTAATRSTFSKYNAPKPSPGKASADATAAIHKVLFIEQDLVVYTKSHHRLVMGRAGHTLRRIHDTAIPDLEEQFACKVVLNLHVKLSDSPQERAKESESEGVDIVFYENHNVE
jgi:GTP-binding protein Era